MDYSRVATATAPQDKPLISKMGEITEQLSKESLALAEVVTSIVTGLVGITPPLPSDVTKTPEPSCKVEYMIGQLAIVANCLDSIRYQIQRL